MLGDLTLNRLALIVDSSIQIDKSLTVLKVTIKNCVWIDGSGETVDPNGQDRKIH